ncbi:PPS1 (YBR276C) [Zygosaccharomyces parabailii]|nr:PPS1 (YBR276C) [Zygosaccharomyces parabailii]
MHVTPMERRYSFKRQNSASDEIRESVIPTKRQDFDKPCSRPTISPHELWKQLQKHMSSPLPECDTVFPWLHGYSTSAPPEYPNSISIVRSQPMPEGWIQNSGVLKCSLDPHEFLISWSSLGSSQFGQDDLLLRDLVCKELSNSSLNMSHEDIEDAISLCLEYGVLPFLNSDGHAIESYSINRKVGNSRAQSSRVPWKQPGSFRRFDLQAAKMLEMSSQIVVYCFHDEEAHRSCKDRCTRCHKLATVLSLALKFVQRNYSEDVQRESSISILKYKSLKEFPTGLMGTPPMTVDSLNKSSPAQLVSPFDLVSFNNWDRDLLYREKLEVSKMSSATPVERTLSCWCGNSTDYQVYKLHAMDSKDTRTSKQRLAYYSAQNTIVGLSKLECEPNDPTSADEKLFNIPHTPRPWKFMIRCLEKASLPPLEKVMTCLGAVIRSPDLKSIELNFPSSGTITLGSLNINSIKIILNTCYVLYQVGNVTEYASLLYCSDGYTETTFLLVAYLIYLWDLPLEETLLKLHSKYERPFFLFPVDLQVLGHLQSLLRQFSPKRRENSPFYETHGDTVLEPLEITPDMFSKIFLFRIPSESDFSNLKGPLPSRILPHLYLGSLEHAQCPSLLKKLGISYIVSVGENLSWAGPMSTRNRSVSSPSPINPEIITIKPRGSTVSGQQKGADEQMFRSIDMFEQEGFKILRIANLGDNGKDTLTSQLEQILAFIDECYQNNRKVLVHCMVGVSRSATVCIAECMKRLKCSVLRAYLFVRVRRLNIIIQPNLMFMYELLKWQEEQGSARTIDWPIICRSISELNNNYI